MNACLLSGCSEALLAPAIPSVAARSGGLILPLVTSLSEACGSKASDGTASKLGAFLIMTVFQVRQAVIIVLSYVHKIWPAEMSLQHN